MPQVVFTSDADLTPLLMTALTVPYLRRLWENFMSVVDEYGLIKGFCRTCKTKDLLKRALTRKGNLKYISTTTGRSWYQKTECHKCHSKAVSEAKYQRQKREFFEWELPVGKPLNFIFGITRLVGCFSWRQSLCFCYSRKRMNGP